MALEINLAVLISVGVIAVSGIGGYAVLKKRVDDLEEEDNLPVDKHADLCTIAKLEMKQHLTDTLVDFTTKTFQPAIDRIINEVKNRKP